MRSLNDRSVLKREGSGESYVLRYQVFNIPDQTILLFQFRPELLMKLLRETAPHVSVYLNNSMYGMDWPAYTYCH